MNAAIVALQQIPAYGFDVADQRSLQPRQDTTVHSSWRARSQHSWSWSSRCQANEGKRSETAGGGMRMSTAERQRTARVSLARVMGGMGLTYGLTEAKNNHTRPDRARHTPSPPCLSLDRTGTLERAAGGFAAGCPGPCASPDTPLYRQAPTHSSPRPHAPHPTYDLNESGPHGFPTVQPSSA